MKVTWKSVGNLVGSVAIFSALVAAAFYTEKLWPNVDDTEKEFELESGFIFKNKRCEENGDTRICWFRVPMFSPALGHQHDHLAIYKCNPRECTWLEEP